MNEYGDHFKKRIQAANGQPVRKQKSQKKNAPSAQNRRAGGHKSSPLWLMLIVSVIAFGALGYLFGGEEAANRLLSRLEISVLGEADAAEGEEAKPAADKPKSEEKKSADAAADAAANVKNAKPAQKTWSEEEVSLFTKLDARKKQLDDREAALNKLEEELQRQKEDLDKKLTALEEVRGKIAGRLEDKVKVDQQKVDSLVSVYTNMKPAQAAKILEGLNEDLAVEVLGKMKNKSAAEILNMMDPEKAKKLSERFVGTREPAAAN